MPVRFKIAADPLGLRRRAVISEAQMAKCAEYSHELPPCALAFSFDSAWRVSARTTDRDPRRGSRYLLVDEIPNAKRCVVTARNQYAARAIASERRDRARVADELRGRLLAVEVP